MIEDEAADKETYNTDYYWEKGASDIKNQIGKAIDAVFCGSDYLGTNRFEGLYSPESEVIYFERKEVPVSSTDIRKWAFSNWDYIPRICRPYYAKKVLVVGGESTGKSTLVENLAIAYNTNFVSEVGRDITEIAGCEELMIMEDFLEILFKHKTNEMNAMKDCNRILFLEPTVFFVQDGTRSQVIARDREKYSKQIKTILRQSWFKLFLHIRRLFKPV